MRAIIFLLLIVLLFLVLRLGIQKIQEIQNQQKSKANLKQQGAEKMVQCVFCQVHLPEKEAVINKGKIYCSEEHKNLENI